MAPATAGRALYQFEAKTGKVLGTFGANFGFLADRFLAKGAVDLGGLKLLVGLLHRSAAPRAVVSVPATAGLRTARRTLKSARPRLGSEEQDTQTGKNDSGSEEDEADSHRGDANQSRYEQKAATSGDQDAAREFPVPG